MQRRNFIKNISIAGGVIAVTGNASFSTFAGEAALAPLQEPWFDKAMRWAQVAFVENDPEKYDPLFWLDYFKKAYIDGIF